MAEREGFEPSKGFNTLTPLAGERLQPLGHLSARGTAVRRAPRVGRSSCRGWRMSTAPGRIPLHVAPAAVGVDHVAAAFLDLCRVGLLALRGAAIGLAGLDEFDPEVGLGQGI